VFSETGHGNRQLERSREATIKMLNSYPSTPLGTTVFIATINV